MVVWGGWNGTVTLDTGGRYDPETNQWAATSMGPDKPAKRNVHSAVWTGGEMIIWGGYDPGVAQYFNNGGRYDPAGDSWRPVSTDANVPSARSRHTAVWTGSEMIVWGGHDALDYLNTGGRYCAACVLQTWYEDADSDGHGDADDSQSSCLQPGGYVADGSDCDDADPGAWHAPSEVADVGVSRIMGGVELTWASQAATAGSATTYDIVSGGIAELLTTGSFGGASCLASDQPTPPFDDMRPAPSPSNGDFSVLRAGNGCGNATYGDATITPDPRDVLDATSPCP
jgi:hypothetical protein